MYLSGRMSKVPFVLEETEFSLPFMLANGIYPDCAMFLKTIAEPRTDAERHFAKRQEAARKDIERAFGVLKKVFKIIKCPSLCKSVSSRCVL